MKSFESGSSLSGLKRKNLTANDYVYGVLNFDGNVLARTITLIESNIPTHHDTS